MVVDFAKAAFHSMTPFMLDAANDGSPPDLHVLARQAGRQALGLFGLLAQLAD